MIYRKKESKEFTIPGGTSGRIYPSKKLDKQSFAVVKSAGVYPEVGYSVNDFCTETLYVVKGAIEIELNGVWEELIAGDFVVIEPNTKYKIKGEAEVVDFIIPAWDPKQNNIIKE